MGGRGCDTHSRRRCIFPRKQQTTRRDQSDREEARHKPQNSHGRTFTSKRRIFYILKRRRKEYRTLIRAEHTRKRQNVPAGPAGQGPHWQHKTVYARLAARNKVRQKKKEHEGSLRGEGGQFKRRKKTKTSPVSCMSRAPTSKTPGPAFSAWHKRSEGQEQGTNRRTKNERKPGGRTVALLALLNNAVYCTGHTMKRPASTPAPVRPNGQSKRPSQKDLRGPEPAGAVNGRFFLVSFVVLFFCSYSVQVLVFVKCRHCHPRPFLLPSCLYPSRDFER